MYVLTITAYIWENMDLATKECAENVDGLHSNLVFK